MLGGYTCGLGSQTVWLRTLALLPTNWEAVNFSLPQFPLIQLVLASIIGLCYRCRKRVPYINSISFHNGHLYRDVIILFHR